MRRTLRLRSESLAELAMSELGSVAGGALSSTCFDCWSPHQCPIPTLPLRECPLDT